MRNVQKDRTHAENLHLWRKVSQACFTVQLDDFHPLPLHVLTHEAEALVFKVTFELGIDLRSTTDESEPTLTVSTMQVRTIAALS